MAKNITIDGHTYNGIESVSINGNIFGEGASNYTEEVLRRNYSPNGQAFVDTVAINLARGDYIEAQVDLTNQPDSRIVLGVGEDISIWPGVAKSDNVIYVYHNQKGTGFNSISYMHSVEGTTGHARSTNKTIPSVNNMNLKVSAAGLWVNNILIKPSEFEIADPEKGNGIYPVRSALLDATTLQVGAAQSDSDFSYAYYNYIKVFRRLT